MKGLLVLIMLVPIISMANIEPVIVTEQGIKIGLKEILYYGFSEGDEIEFNIEVIKGKPLKEVEIVEYPNSVKYSDYEVKKITGKKIKVNKTGIYQFTIKGRVGKQICRIKISRTPASEATINFNTGVELITRLDTVYMNTGGTTRKLVSCDTSVVTITDRTERVNAGATVSFNLQLPKNKRTEHETSEVVGWAYWIGTGNEGRESYGKAEKDFLMKKTSTVSALVGNPLAGLALGVFATFYNPPSGENVEYSIKTFNQGNVYSLANGNSIVSFGREERLKQGGFTVYLSNDNFMDKINVDVKIAAIMITKKYDNSEEVTPLIIPSVYPIMIGN